MYFWALNECKVDRELTTPGLNSFSQLYFYRKSVNCINGYFRIENDSLYFIFLRYF